MLLPRHKMLPVVMVYDFTILIKENRRISYINIKSACKGEATMTSYKNINMIRIITFSFFCIVFITLSSPEAHAAASGGGGGGALFGSLTNFLNALQDLLTGTWARIIAIIAVVILGFGWMTGRISWYIAGSVIGGIILVFGAAAIVDSISGSI